MALKHMQIINFHDDKELQCHMSMATIDMKVKNKEM